MQSATQTEAENRHGDADQLQGAASHILGVNVRRAQRVDGLPQHQGRKRLHVNACHQQYGAQRICPTVPAQKLPYQN